MCVYKYTYIHNVCDYHAYSISLYIHRYISKNLNVMKKVNIFCHSFQKMKSIYYIDSLHIEWNISSFYFLKCLWLWLTDNENPKFSVQISKWNAKLISSEKRTLDHWATVQFFYSLVQVRCFWRCFWFRSGLVALFLKMSERGDSWCTDSRFSSLLVKLSQVFKSALLDSILKRAVIPVAWAHFPTQFLPSSQLCF